MKSERHKIILEIIESNNVDRQEILLQLLHERGIQVTQATVSRDIRDLGLNKVSMGDGTYRYALSAHNDESTAPINKRFDTIFKESVVNVDFAGHIVLVKCFSGMANAACQVFDSLSWNGVVGTLSGDDTFFILSKTEHDALKICSELKAYVNEHK